jgi:hypothetical protein
MSHRKIRRKNETHSVQKSFFYDFVDRLFHIASPKKVISDIISTGVIRVCNSTDKDDRRRYVRKHVANSIYL